MGKVSIIKKSVSLILCTIMSMSFFACGGTVIEDDDLGKTKLLVKASSGGYGVKWLEDLKIVFEQQHPDVRVGIEANAPIGAAFTNSYETESGDIYFPEQIDNYYSMVNADQLLDITDVVTETIDNQDKTIAESMEETPRDFYGISDENGNPHYYAIPWANGFYGIHYDTEMFYNYGFYYSKAIDDNQKIDNNSAFIAPFTAADGKYENLVVEGDKTYRKTVKNDILSHGPDGIYGTEDDGEPATYEEFFRLCDYMVENSIKPFVWMGNGSNYCMWMLASSAAPDYEGYEQTELAYNFNGTAVNLIDSIRADGSVVKMSPQEITENMENKQIMYKSAGRYYALKFFEKMIERKGEKYVLHDSFTGTIFDHLTAQETFMRSRKQNKKQKNKAAFLVDGCWWENESERVDKQNSLAEEFNDESYKKMNRKFKLLSMPKINRDNLGKPTYLDVNYMAAFIPKKIKENKVELAKEFLKLAFSEKSNIEFTKTVGLPRPFKYSLSEDDLSCLSNYSKSIWKKTKIEKNIIAYPFSGSEFYLKKSHEINPKFEFHCNIKGIKHVNIFDSFITKGYNAKEIFDGIYTESKIRIGN